MTDSKRAHPLHAKYLLATMALRDTQLFFEFFGHAEGDERLTRFWQRLGDDLPPEDRVEAEGLSARGGALDDGTATVLLGLPAPDRNHAHFLVAVAGGERVRVFCLERSVMFPDQAECTVIAELAPDHRANWGSGPGPDPAQFMAAVAAIVSGNRPGPLAVTPMQLV